MSLRGNGWNQSEIAPSTIFLKNAGWTSFGLIMFPTVSDGFRRFPTVFPTVSDRFHFSERLIGPMMLMLGKKVVIL